MIRPEPTEDDEISVMEELLANEEIVLANMPDDRFKTIWETLHNNNKLLLTQMRLNDTLWFAIRTLKEKIDASLEVEQA